MVGGRRVQTAGSSRLPGSWFNRFRTCWRRSGLPLASLAALVLLLGSSPTVLAQRAPAQFTTIEAITGNPAAFYGRTVTVIGDIQEMLAPRAFVLEGNNLLSNDDLLVIAERPILDELGGHSDVRLVLPNNVQASGVVYPFNLPAFERYLAIDLPDAALADWYGRPTLLARALSNSPYIVGPYPFTEGPVGRTVDEIVDNPTLFYGQEVAVLGDFETAYGPRVFTLEDGDFLFDDEILVVAAGPLLDPFGRPIPAGAVLSGVTGVIGTVLPLDTVSLGRQLGLDLTAQVGLDWEGQPVIVARSVTPYNGTVLPTAR